MIIPHEKTEADQVIDLFSKGFNIEVLEEALLSVTDFSDPRMQTIHRFSPGLYIREMQMPKGAIVLGHAHKSSQLNICIKGSLTLLGEDGTTKEVQAPMIFVGGPGRKCAYVHEDLVWLNVYPTDETDIDKLEEMFWDKSEYSQDFVKNLDIRKYETITDLSKEAPLCLDG